MSTLITTTFLVADDVSNPATNLVGPTDVLPSSASCGIELQSVDTALLLSRVDDAETVILEPVNGMICLDTTGRDGDGDILGRINNTWLSLSGGLDAGDVFGPDDSVARTIAVYEDTSGKFITNTGMQIPVVANPVNFLEFLESAAGDSVQIKSIGADDNIRILILAKGTGTVGIGNADQNFLEITGAADDDPVIISAVGTGDPIGIVLQPKGTGQVSILGPDNNLILAGSAIGDPLGIGAIGTDADISIVLQPKGDGAIIISSGTVGTPTLVWDEDHRTGFSSSVAGEIDFSSEGVLSATLGLHSFDVHGLNNTLSLTGTATGNPVHIDASGTDANISIEYIPKGTGANIFNDGLAATPSVVFAGDPTTGFYHVGAGDVGFSSAGVLSTTLNAAGILVPAGSVGIPSITFAGDTNTGIYHVGDGAIAFTDNAARSFEIDLNKNLLLNNQTAGTNAVSVICLPTATAPTTGPGVQGTQIYSAHVAGEDTIGIFGSVTPVVATPITAADHSLAIVINGVTYYIPCKATRD